MPPIYAYCLGRFTVTITATDRQTQTEIRFATDRAQALLAYLLNQPHEAHRRDYLAYLMWPERPDTLARQNFRQTLSRLRRAGKPYELIESDRHVVRLNTAVVQSDLADFRQAIQNGHLAQASQLYRGEFLHGFHLSDNPAFDEWFLLTREAWQRQARELLASLVTQAMQAQKWAEAITYAQQYVAQEPWDEGMHRILLTALAENNQRPEALAHYQTYVADLQRELGISPEAETGQLVQKLEGVGVSLVTSKADTAVSSVWHGFPVGQTSFVGRTAEIEAIQTHLTQADSLGRLVTITGTGGMGKTRLASQVAQGLHAEQFPDGIYFVDCTAVDTLADFLPHLISQLGLELDNSRSTRQQLEQFLTRHPRLLLLLDNFEQLSAHSAELLAPLRRGQTTLLITSRHALNLQGEHRFNLRGLLDNATGENLFIARARRYGFEQFSPAERQLIQELVKLVAGMPLAIEMAAAWLRAYDLPTLLQFLQENLALWVAPHADLPQRHQSLEAVFAGSWELLPPTLQIVWARLSLLQGRFTAEAAQKISQASFFELAQLVDRSLLSVGRNGRYRSHPLLRQLARGKLAEQPDEEQATAVRHAQYYLHELHQAGRPLRGPRSKQAVRKIRQEFENMRAGWLWAQKTGDEALLQEAARPWADYFLLTSLYEEGAALLQAVDRLLSAELWLERQAYTAVLDLLEPHPERTDLTRQLRRETLLAAAYHGQGQRAKLDTAVSRALPLAQQQPDSVPAAYFYLQATNYHVQQGEPEPARAYAQQALSIFYQVDDLWGATKALYAKAVVDGITNQNARPHFLQILHLQRQIGSLAIQRHALNNLALSHMLQGEYALALEVCHEAYELCLRLNHELLIAENRLLWGRIQTRMGNWVEAEAAYQEAMVVWERLARPFWLGQGLVYTAVLQSSRGEPKLAVATSKHAHLWAQQTQNPFLAGFVAWSLARAWAGLGEWAQAEEKGNTAVEILTHLRLPGRIMDARAIVAYAQWQQGQKQAALTQVADILTYRAEVEWLKSDDPFFLEYCCYEVLHGAGDGRAAVLWTETHNRLLTQIRDLDEAGVSHNMADVPHHQKFT